MKALSQILRCTPVTARQVWGVVSTKFVRDDIGEWRNARMEDVRSAANTFLARQASNGAKGGRPKKPTENPRVISGLTHFITQTEARKSQSKPNSNSESNTPPVGGVETPPPPLVKKRKPFNFHEGIRIEVPQRWHEDHVRKLGLADAEAKLLAWYEELDAQLVRSQRPVGNWFKWLDACYEPWANDLAASDELERFRPKGA
jgi:hypothetical protein